MCKNHKHAAYFKAFSLSKKTAKLEHVSRLVVKILMQSQEARRLKIHESLETPLPHLYKVKKNCIIIPIILKSNK